MFLINLNDYLPIRRKSRSAGNFVKKITSSGKGRPAMVPPSPD